MARGARSNVFQRGKVLFVCPVCSMKYLLKQQMLRDEALYCQQCNGGGQVELKRGKR